MRRRNASGSAIRTFASISSGMRSPLQSEIANLKSKRRYSNHGSALRAARMCLAQCASSRSG